MLECSVKLPGTPNRFFETVVLLEPAPGRVFFLLHFSFIALAEPVLARGWACLADRPGTRAGKYEPPGLFFVRCVSKPRGKINPAAHHVAWVVAIS